MAIFPASNIMDGKLDTFCATASAQFSDQWVSLSVAVPGGMGIGYVAVMNRQDAWAVANAAQQWLLPFELWLGSSYGSLQYRCGGAAAGSSLAGPYTMWCGEAPAGLSFVTVLLRSGTSRQAASSDVWPTQRYCCCGR